MKSKEYEKRDKIVNEERINVKLSKLIITKFDVRLWTRSVFGTSLRVRLTRLISCELTSCLKELLIPRIRLLIDGLRFTSEGYSRAKSVLLDEL